MQKYLILILLLLSTTFTHAQFAGDHNHPELTWNVLETEHFKIYYHQGLDPFAKRTAKVAEEIYLPVTQLYHFEPDEKVRIILKDIDDYANGAAYYYHNTIEIWVTNLDFDLRGTTDWVKNVVTHEFTHIVSLQTGRKGSRKVPALFFHYLRYQGEGKRDDILDSYPNVLALYAIPMTMIPPWFSEGTAQYMARGVQFDRWDSHRDMILRQATLNNTLLTYPEMNVFGAKTGLGFEKIYDHGYSLVLFIANTFGEDKLEGLYRSMATWWRYDFDGATKSVLGISGHELYNRWVSSLEERYKAQKIRIDFNPAPGTLLHQKGYLNLHPRWSPDGTQLAFLSNQGQDYGRTSLVSFTLSDSSLKRISPSANTAFDWSPDGNHILYTRRSQPNRYGSRFWDLYTVPPDASGEGPFQQMKDAIGLSRSTFPGETRLTHDIRAIHPAYSPDGTRIAFVKNGGGNANLGILDVNTGEIRSLTDFKDGTQVYTPQWSPDGSQIAFSIFQPGSSRDIATILPEGGPWTLQAASSGTDRDPCWTPDGNGLIFASDNEGIFDLYHLTLADGTIHRITRVLGGAFQPHINPKDGRVAFSHYGKTAYEIRIIDGKGLWERADSDAFRAPNQNPIASNVSDIPGARPYKGEYGTTSIIPRIGIETGKLKLGAAVVSEDVLGKQSLFLSALTSHDFDLNLFAIYEYRTRRPTFFLEAYRLRRSVEEDVLNRDLDFRLFNQVFTLIGLEFGAKYKMRRGGLIDGRLIYSRGGTTQQVARFNGLGRTTIGATPLNGLDLAFTYHLDALARSRDSGINPRQGRQFTFRYDRYFNWFFSGFEENTALLIEKYDRYFYNQLTLDWNEFIPLPGRSALGVRFFGGVIDKAVDNTFDFFIGGLPGMKGYSFYSLEGSRALMFRASYRFPLLSRINQQTGPIYSDQFYGALFAGIGRAWDGSAQDDVLKRSWKREIGAQLRYDASSFYLFPTRISLDAAYGFDTIPLQDPRDPIQKSGLKMYFTLLFGFLQSVGGR